MDLRSARTRASFHPLTALIEYEGGWEQRPFYGIPFVAPGDWSDFSTIQHELTHLWCLRTTRLGWALGRMAAEALTRWQQQPQAPVPVHPQFAALWGAYAGLLEGLAIYAQLDYEVVADDDPMLLPGPLTRHAELVEPDRQLGFLQILRGAREYEIYGQPNRPGLLSLLMLTGLPAQNHYFAGYLYVKAIAAVIGQHAPRLARPDTLLPLLIRLWCSHPALDNTFGDGIKAENLLAELHATILRVTPAQWLGLAQMIGTNLELVANFDHWDVHAQLEANRFDTPMLTKAEDIYPILGPLLDGPLAMLAEVVRASVSTYLLTHSTGVLQHLELRENRLELDTPHGSQSVQLVPIDAMWNFWQQFPNEQLAEKLGATWKYAQAHDYLLRHTLEQAVGKEITLANFITLTQPGSFGIVLWVDGQAHPLAYTPDYYLVKEENNIEALITLRATTLSPGDRRRFASMLQLDAELDAARARTGEQLLSYLVGSLRSRQLLLSRRLAFARSPSAQQITAWCHPSPLRKGPWLLAPEASAWLNTIFDFPGFPVNVQGMLRFGDLLPKLEPIL